MKYLLYVSVLISTSTVFAQVSPCGGTPGRMWFNYDDNTPGGFVADTATVSSIHLSQDSEICDMAFVYNANVLGKSVIKGNAIVQSGDNTLITVEDSIIEDQAQIYDSVQVRNGATISDE